MKEIDTFYFQQSEPNRGCLLALRGFILAQNPGISHSLKYGMPFFCYKGKMFCYLWVHKKSSRPYLGIVEGKYFNETYLEQEKRSRMKILFINPAEDLPFDTIGIIIRKAIHLYTSGAIKTYP
jgi:hypothetical protein